MEPRQLWIGYYPRERKKKSGRDWVSEWLSEWVSEWESKRGWRLVVWFLSWKWTPDAFNLSAATVKVFRPPWQHQLFVSHDDMMTRAPNSSHQLQNHIRNLPISKVSNQQSEIYKFQRPLTCWMWLSNFDWEIYTRILNALNLPLAWTLFYSLI